MKPKLNGIEYMDGGCCRGRTGPDGMQDILIEDDDMKDIIDDDNKQRAADLNTTLADIGGWE